MVAQTPTAIAAAAHMNHLVDQLHRLEERLRAGGGPAKIEKQHRAGKLTARERIAGLLDPGAWFQEIGLLIAHDRYDGQAPSAGVVTGIGKIEGRPAVVVAKDATVRAGARWPEILARESSAAQRAALWPLEEPEFFVPIRSYDLLRFTLGLPHAGID